MQEVPQHSTQKEMYTIASLEKYTEVPFSKNYVHHFGIAICILDDNIYKLPFKILPAAIV